MSLPTEAKENTSGMHRRGNDSSPASITSSVEKHTEKRSRAAFESRGINEDSWLNYWQNTQKAACRPAEPHAEVSAPCAAFSLHFVWRSSDTTVFQSIPNPFLGLSTCQYPVPITIRLQKIMQRIERQILLKTDRKTEI